MAAARIIARLDIKGNQLIKGRHLEGWRMLGDPMEFSKRYYLEGIDELIYIDSVASLYSRNLITEIIKGTTESIFVPFTVGGGIRSANDAFNLLRAGADKIAINSQALKTPHLIREISEKFGSQCVVLSIQAKKIADGCWSAFYDSARENSGRDVIEWVQEAAEQGIGEILLTSVDQEGTRQGFDDELIQQVSKAVNVPIIASGGFATPLDFVKAVHSGASAVAIADAIHYRRIRLAEVREVALENNIPIRT